MKPAAACEQTALAFKVLDERGRSLTQGTVWNLPAAGRRGEWMPLNEEPILSRDTCYHLLGARRLWSCLSPHIYLAEYRTNEVHDPEFSK